MSKHEKEELSLWWNGTTQKIRKEVLIDAGFSSSDITKYKLHKQSIQRLESIVDPFLIGWGVENILSARLRLGYYKEEGPWYRR